MPNKVVLSRRTMGTCIQSLKQLLERKASHQYFRNQKPLGKLVESNRSSFLYKHRCAVVKVHPLAKINKLGNVLIHVYVNEETAFVFHEGDVFYLFGGKKIIVDCKSSSMFSCYSLQPRIHRDACVIKSL